jgi:anti-sigma factor RsiW
MPRSAEALPPARGSRASRRGPERSFRSLNRSAAALRARKIAASIASIRSDSVLHDEVPVHDAFEHRVGQRRDPVQTAS